jgi:hypothetical protein
MSRSGLALLLACAALGIAGCQKAADTTTEAAISRASGDQVEVDRDGGQVRIKTADGELTMQAGDALPLPADFPKDVYLPGRYEVYSVMDMGGWTQTMSMQHSADSAMLSYEKDARAAVLSFNRGEGSDGVVMAVQLREETQ